MMNRVSPGPPFSDSRIRDIERCLLGSYIQGAAIGEGIGEAVFCLGSHRAIFAAICELKARGLDLNIMVLVSELTKRGKLDEAGGAAAVAALTDAVASPANAAFYEAEALAAFRGRAAWRAAALAKEALEQREAPDAVVTRLAAALETVTCTGNTENFPIVRMGRGSVSPPAWIVKGILAADSFCVIYGGSGAGKSFLALDLAASVATGRPFHGAPVKRQGGVLYIAGEGQAGLESRLAAWQKFTGQSLESFPLYLNAKAANLIADPAAAERDITAAARTIPGLRLIIVDTWARCLGGDDSAPSDAARGVQVLDDIRRNLPGIAVVIITHTGHAAKDRARGWSGVYAAADTSFRVESPDDTLVFTADKCKDGALPAPAAYRKEIVGLGVFDEDGAELTSIVIGERVDVPASCIPGGKVNASDLLVAEYERLSESGAAVKKADLKAACIRAGMSERTYQRAQRDVLAAARLAECGVQKKGRPDSLMALENEGQNEGHKIMSMSMTATGQTDERQTDTALYNKAVSVSHSVPVRHSGKKEKPPGEEGGTLFQESPVHNPEEYEIW